MTDFDKALVERYGTQIEDDLSIIKDKFAAVISAHLIDNCFYQSEILKDFHDLNDVLKKIIKK